MSLTQNVPSFLNFTTMDWIVILNGVGIFVFTISGVLTAIDKDFDVVGASIIGFVTALGGGTLRDMMIGETPVSWMQHSSYLLIILGAILTSFFFKKRIMKLKKSMFVFDTIGIGLFTVLGVQSSLALDLGAPVSIMMGIVSAVFGGVVRDVLCNEIPLIFRREIYASACMAGGVVFIVLLKLSINLELNMGISMFIVFIIRYFAVKRNWTLNFSSVIKDKQ
jgi:uncharacterized membrane protein YeiH